MLPHQFSAKYEIHALLIDRLIVPSPRSWLKSKTAGKMPAVLAAPQVGFEPTTLRLTAACSAVELLRNSERNYNKWPIPVKQWHLLIHLPIIE